MSMSQELIEDRQLVDRCLLGDSKAWSKIYHLHHDRLLMAIRTLTFGNQANAELVDEIVARVWFAVVDNDARLLDRFDPQRGCRLIAFLTGIAKFETLNFFRSERRRKRREEYVSQAVEQQLETQWQQRMEIEDFTNLLTPGEQKYLACELNSLLNEGEQIAGRDISDTSRWQYRSRIQKKLKIYTKND